MNGFDAGRMPLIVGEQISLFQCGEMVQTPGENLTIPPIESLTVRRRDEPQFVAAS